MLAVTDDQHALAAAFANDKLKAPIGWIDSDEGHGPMVVLARRYRALPLAEIEGSHAVFGEHINCAQLFAGIVLGQVAD